MRVLHLTTEFPWPVTSGGTVRTVSQLKILSSLDEVLGITTLSVAEHDVSTETLATFAENVPKLRVEPPVFHPVHLFDFKRYVPRVVGLRALGVPYLAAKWDSPKLRDKILRALAGGMDVAYVDHLGMARYLADIRRARPKCRIVLDQHNVESDFFGQFAEKKRGPKGLAARAEHKAATRFEIETMRAVDAVVAISREDAVRFERMAGVSATLVPVVMNFERRVWKASGAPRFCYVGNLRWHPNVAGLDWFCQKVWPLVRARLPNATFEIAGVGLKPDASGRLPVPETWRGAGIETIGFMEDLEPLYARSIAMISPVFGGSGVRMKLLEGFRAGVPVVTTPDGAFGLPIEDGREALVASDPEPFAERVERMAKDASLREKIASAGYAYLEAHHSLAVAQKSMRNVLGL